ncbi:MAG: S8 family peptidase [Candidatus Methylumidiphilus sp.]
MHTKPPAHYCFSTSAAHWLATAAFFGLAVGAQAAEIPLTGEILVSSTNSSPGRQDVNAIVNANRFYNQGYSGTRAIMANIEAQTIWNGHESLTQVQTFVHGTGTSAVTAPGSHPTSVGQTMGGRPLGNTLRSGIAPNATLWSGAIATSVSGANFNITNASVASVYAPILKTGVTDQTTGISGKTADVFNSSWGGTDPTGLTGFNTYTLGIDGLLYQTGKIGVVSAGNSGSSANTIGWPASGYNTIAVAALGTAFDTIPYNQVSSFSSRGPNDYYNPNNGQTIAGVRARIDIAAPGENLILATNDNNSSNSYASGKQGTSFAAPIVAGGAALVADAGKAIYAGNANAIDGRVVKAVLLNGADKTSGWNNGQATVSGVVTTTQSLDYAAGAGRMNLDKTYNQYVDPGHGGKAGTTDVLGHDCLTGGACDMGTVSATGWDYGWANQGGSNNYYIGQQLNGGKLFTATLDWFANINSGSDTDFTGTSYKHLANLNLSVFEYNPLNHAILRTVAESTSLYNIVEHLYFTLPATGYYGLTVSSAADLWNFNSSTGEYFGLAWTSAVPAPSTLLLALAGWAGMTASARQKRGKRRAA